MKTTSKMKAASNDNFFKNTEKLKSEDEPYWVEYEINGASLKATTD